MHTMMLLIGICIFLFAVEEFLHLRYRRAGLLENSDEVDSTVTAGERNAVARLSMVRWFQLTAICILFATTGDMARFGFFGCGAGQVGTVLIAMQIVRVIGRRMVNRWLVLGILQLQQLVLLVTLPYLWIAGQGVVPADRVYPVVLWISAVSGALAASILAITFSFCVTYLLRLRLRETSRIFPKMPPLVYSESWTKRLVGMAIIPVFLTMSGLAVLSVARSRLEPALVPALLVLGLLATALELVRGHGRFHHPAANILTTLAVLVVFAATLTGFTTFTCIRG
jgi:hypothetical protein